MSLALQLVLAFIIYAGGVGTGIKWHAGEIARRDLVAQQQQAKEVGIKLARGDKAAVAFEGDKARIRTEFLTITEKVDRVVQNPVYRDMCFDAAGVQLVNTAINPAAAAASQPAPSVPGSASPE